MIFKKQYWYYLIIALIVVGIPYLVISKLNVNAKYQNYALVEQQIIAQSKHDVLSNGVKLITIKQTVQHGKYIARLVINTDYDVKMSSINWYVHGAHDEVNTVESILVNGEKTDTLTAGKNIIDIETKIDNHGLKNTI